MKVLVVLLMFLTSGTAYPCADQKPLPAMGERLVELVKIINKERKSRGLNALKIDPKLNCAAQRHSDDVGPKKLCQHDGTDKSSPWDRAKDCGTTARSENIACGHGTPRAAVNGWLNSDGHFKNMMHKDRKFIGAGVANNFWTTIYR